MSDSSAPGSDTDETYSDASGYGQIIPFPRLRRPAVPYAGGRAEGKWETAVLQELLRLGRMKQNWDSYGSPAIRSDACFFALVILDAVMQPQTPLPQVVPSSSGGVQLEWHERAIDLELHVLGTYECEMWFVDHTVQPPAPVAVEVTNDFTAIQTAIRTLTSRVPAQGPAHAAGAH